MTTTSSVRVAVTGVSKRFGATQALRDVSLDVFAGEVHSLVGENGAGKSTLGKVIVGVHQPDSGSMAIDGQPVSFFHNPAQAATHGFVGVAQELALIPNLTVVQNVVLGAEPGKGPFLDNSLARERVAELAAEHHFELDLDRPVIELTIADQQKVELLRALSRSLDLVVFDEPTARLASHEALELRHTVRQLAERGVAVIYISHFLDEVLAVSDRITTMRDGAIVRTSKASDETRSGLVEAMTGRSMNSMFPPLPPRPADDAKVVLKVDGIGSGDVFSDISFEVRAGEIVGFAGLVGAGRSDVAMAVYGATPIQSGSITVDGSPMASPSVAGAIKAGISMIPESRRHQGLVIDRSVTDNTTLPFLDRFRSFVTLNSRAIRRATDKAVGQATVKAASINAPVSSLSGGNQQKVLFARAMMADPTLLIADEPTRGVDVGAKEGIYGLIAGLAEKGCGVMLISSEMEEVLGLSHRVIVMRNGRIAAELSGEQMTESDVLQAAFGPEDAAKAASPDSRSAESASTGTDSTRSASTESES